MEVRCGSCAKLFRVSDDKITGTGIQFKCSRCGEYVRITKEDREHHALSQSAVSVLDLFEPKPKTAKAPLQSKTGETGGGAPAGTADFPSVDLSPKPDLGALQREPASVFSESASYEPAPATEERSAPAFSEPDLFAEAKPVAVPKPALSVEPGPTAEPKSAPEPQPVPKSAPAPETTTAPRSEPELKSELKQEPNKATLSPKVEASAVSVPKPELVRPPASAAPRPASVVQSKTPKKETPRTVPPVEEQTEKLKMKETPPAPSRSGNMLLYVIVLLVVLALAGYGAFTFFRSGPQKGQDAVSVMVSTEGLHIVNPAGAPDANGDLLITGVVENSLDVARPAWYVVIDVYNAEGVVLTKLRSLNGKQLYTKRDFELLVKRGTDIQYLKAKIRQEPGVVIPPKGSVSFEVRYVQPPVGVASFNATLQPFDPVRLFNEIAAENK